MGKKLAILLALSVIPCFTFAQGVLAEETTGLQSDVVVLYTSDIHCKVDENWGLDGLSAIKSYYESTGNHVLLVDDGDAIQGDTLGTLTNGEAIIELMNEVGYDIAIPGNHEFDYGLDQFLNLTEKADFEYLSCNFNKEGELILPPYTIKEFDGVKIGFVGVTTPETLFTSTPKYFMDENENFIYDFNGDETGDALAQALQKAVDDCRGEGAEYVICLAHLGNLAQSHPWTYDDMIGKTNGIDALLDGHSHDTDQLMVANKDGKMIPRSAVGTGLRCIGCLTISTDGTLDTNLLCCESSIPITTLLGVNNSVTESLAAKKEELGELINETIAVSKVDLTIHDPNAKDDNDMPIRIVRRSETNLGDLCADAYRYACDADIAIANGGGVRSTVPMGDLTYGDILSILPFQNSLTVIKISGQQILDALEWGAREVPEECGGFLQVSGLTYEIHTYIDSSCTMDDNGLFTGIDGEYRVKNVLVNGEPLDLEKEYTVAGLYFTLLNNGDGYTMFKDCEIIMKGGILDNQAFTAYINEVLGGIVSEGYENPYGQGRIVAVEEPPVA